MINDRQESAIVRSSVSVKETISQLKSMNMALVKSKEEIGKILIALKGACKQEGMSFLEAVEKTGIHIRSAERYMVLVTAPLETRNDKLSYLGNHDGNQENQYQQQVTSNSMPKTVTGNGNQSRAERLGQTAPQSHPALANGVHRNGTPSTNGHREPGDDFHAEGEPGHGKGIRLAVPNDNEGLPKSVQMALNDQWHADCAKALNRMRTECKGAFSWSSWLDGEVLVHLKAAEECFLAAVPKVICPDCKGMKQVKKVACLRCKNGGYLASQVV